MKIRTIDLRVGILGVAVLSAMVACSSDKSVGLHCEFLGGSCECDSHDSTAHEQGYMPAEAKECSAASVGPNGLCCSGPTSNEFRDTGRCVCASLSCVQTDDRCMCSTDLSGKAKDYGGVGVASCRPKSDGEHCCYTSVSFCACSNKACDERDLEVASCGEGVCPDVSATVESCSGASSGSSPPPPPTELTSWAIGDWFAPAYDDDGTGKHIPAKGLGINADGTYTHNTSGRQDDQGTWTTSGDEVTLGQRAKLDRSPNCGFVNYDDGTRIDTYYRSDAPTGCPDAIPALTSAEKCLVGKFVQTTSQNLGSTMLTWTRTAWRNEVLEQIYTGQNSGDAAITTIRYWYIESGKLCEEGIERNPSCAPIDWAMIDSTRQGSKPAGCVEP